MPVIGSIGGATGPQGAPGTNGTNGTNGTPGTQWFDSTTLGLPSGDVPAAGVGNDGDMFIDLNAGATLGRISKKVTGAW